MKEAVRIREHAARRNSVDGTTYQATVVNGQIHLPQNVHRPENGIVYVVIPASSTAPLGTVRSPRLARPEQAVDFQMTVENAADAGV